jgi:recombination protein RecA
VAAPKKQGSDLRDASPADVAKAFSKHLDILTKVGANVTPTWVPTGLASLDKALGIGGIPAGRIIELFGGEGVGKSSLSLHFISCVQKAKGRAVFIDAEHALDLKMAKYVGVDLDTLMFTQPDTSAESILELVRNMLARRAADIIVIDSVASLVPAAVEEKEIGKPTMGLMARLMSESLKILVREVKKSEAILIFVNQTRMKFNVMWGDPTTTPGGNALKFYAGVRMHIKRTGSIKRGGKTIGMESKIILVKNKVATPYQTANVKVVYGKGWEDNNNADEED